MVSGIAPYGLPLIALAAALAVVLLSYLEPGPEFPAREASDHPVAIPGCRGCALASEAGDYYLRRHLERECDQ